MTQEVELLDFKVRKWIHQQGWTGLRDIQREAVRPILSGSTDIIISASTAAGKTEAFFLPAISAVIGEDSGFSILYLSPLKALINDQYRRLESLCEIAEVDVVPWHGDASVSKKQKAKRTPNGIVLITPESLEAQLIRESEWVRRAFAGLKYIVIDEFHAFIGSERGLHLQSLLCRLEQVIAPDRPIPRVALSATLGNIESVPTILRPSTSLPCKIMKGSASGSIRLQVRGYVMPASVSLDVDNDSSKEKIVCGDLYRICRGDSHLVFANSRRRTEILASELSDLCEKNHVPNEFFPHHGSLSKELRETLEARLQKETLPTTALCTMTLELGIDIGKVNSVIQVTAPHSVSSLKQRVGRSGRRGGPATLRMMIVENELTDKSSLQDSLRLELVQSIAMIRLLVQHQWVEPSEQNQCHFSTFLHQVLALIGQWGGIRADQIFTTLCVNGPFKRIEKADFVDLLKHMGQTELIRQMQSGELVLGAMGEKLVSHYTFYAVFKTPEEYRIVSKGKPLGSLPVDYVPAIGQNMIFAGRRWKVVQVDAERKTINVEKTDAGKPPSFGGEGMTVHNRVREEMFHILQMGDCAIEAGTNKLHFLDAQAQNLFEQAVANFHDLNLSHKVLHQFGNRTLILLWKGDRVVRTLTVMLRKYGFEASDFAGIIEVEKAEVSEVRLILQKILTEATEVASTELAELVADKTIEKYDEFLPENLLAKGYGLKQFDVFGLAAELKNTIVD